MSFCSVLPSARVIGRRMIKAFQGWQVAALSCRRETRVPGAPVCPPPDNTYLSGSPLKRHMFVSHRQPFNLPLSVAPFARVFSAPVCACVRTCLSVWICLAEITHNRLTTHSFRNRGNGSFFSRGGKKKNHNKPETTFKAKSLKRLHVW